MTTSRSLRLLAVLVLAAATATATDHPKLTNRVTHALAASPDSTVIVYVYFTDKGPDTVLALIDPLQLVSSRSLERRKKVLPASRLVDYTDLPVYQPYIDTLSAHLTHTRYVLRWLNCVSAELTKTQVLDAAELTCVRRIDLVERYTAVKGDQELGALGASLRKQMMPQTDSLNYGASYAQDTVITVNRVHNEGIFGQGIIVADFDAGFSNLDNDAFTTYPMKIWKKKDFQTGDTVTLAQHSHGEATLSLVGGYKPGALIGPAFASTYVLCRTEVDPTETPNEMDNWAAAAQWSDSLGVDVITSSLGYLTFDPPYPGYTYLDMNGHTMPITLAAELAVQKGITVCNAAGNDGDAAGHNTLGGPADAEHVITVGAINTAGARAYFSSVGPTTDVPPRIKPDVMTVGVANQVAFQTGYSTAGSGTSWATPMAAGVVACMLSANRDLTPLQIAGILRAFASNAHAPNNEIGWGTIDAARSVDSARAMDHTPPLITESGRNIQTADTGALTVTATITDNGIIRAGRASESPRVYYRKNSGAGYGAWTSAHAASIVGDAYAFRLPGSPLGTTVQYYFAAQDIALPRPLASTLPSGGNGSTPPGSTPPPSLYQYTVSLTAVAAAGDAVPTTFTLYNTYPNPFNPSTDIRYDLPTDDDVSLSVYDVTGRLVTTLVHQRQRAGRYSVRFDASAYSSGAYICRLTAGGSAIERKMLLVK